MTFKRHDSVEEFVVAVRPLLMRDEARYCMGLGTLDELTKHSERFGDVHLYSFATENVVTGAAWVAGPLGLGLTELSEDELSGLADELRRHRAKPVAIAGPVQAAHAFARFWAARIPLRIQSVMNQRVHQLEAVVPPASVPGSMRVADAGDREVLIDWTVAFCVDCGLYADRQRATEAVDFALKTGRRFVWEHEGQLRAMTGISGKTPSGMRVTAVYTPPAARRNGYASALVAAVSTELLARGNRRCFLYTDLANPTSNKIYAAIGYQPVAETVRLGLAYADAWLDKAAAFAPEFGAGLSNHLPMALVALTAQGASDAQITAFYARYSRRLKPALAPVAGLELADIDGLMPGVGAAAFHGLIRTAYGLEADHDGEVRRGLAYWKERLLPLGGALPRDDAGVSPVAMLHALAADPAWNARTFADDLIYEDMAAVAADPAFLPLVDGAAFQGRLPEVETLARAVLAIYLATGDFTALHMVTSMHALRLVLPYVGDLRRALRHYWRAAAAAYITIRCPAFQDLPRVASLPDLPEWPDILAAAAASTDDHTVKLVHTCQREQAYYGDAHYQRAAARRVSLIS